MRLIEKAGLSLLIFLSVVSYINADTPDKYEILQLKIERRLDSIFYHSSLVYLPESGKRLTDRDFEEVAEELGVDVPSIKSVVEIEAGKTHRGFFESGEPVINFDISLFRKQLSRRGISQSAITKCPDLSSRSITGSFDEKQYRRYNAAFNIDNEAAIVSTFWGMFQIGGFNWKKCGAASPMEFVEKMNMSERAQLELFAEFLRNAGIVESLRNHNWSEFARKYNGVGYRARGYHKRLAEAYKKFSK